MRIGIRRETKTEKAIAESVAAQPPATVAQRIQATRIMGGVGYALFACFLITIGYAMFANSKTIPVDGKVMSVSSKTTTSNSQKKRGTSTTEYWYKFEYTDLAGELRVGETFGGGTQTAYRKGSFVSVGYYPGDPTKVRIHDVFAGWRYQILLAGLGLVLIAYSIKAVAIIKAEDAATTGGTDM